MSARHQQSDNDVFTEAIYSAVTPTEVEGDDIDDKGLKKAQTALEGFKAVLPLSNEHSTAPPPYRLMANTENLAQSGDRVK